MKNNSLIELSQAIEKANKIILFPHLNADGDALGSSGALCMALKNAGKECIVLIEDEIPGNLKFLNLGQFTTEYNYIQESDLSICIDCGDIGRLGERRKKFVESTVTMCIDHHQTTNPFCQLNYIDPTAAATAQLIFHLLKVMNFTIDKNIGEALFTAIATDTGNFQYSNTSKETHEIVAELYDSGIDSNYVSVELYENVRMERLLITNKAISTIVTVNGGKAVIAYVTQDMLNETGAEMSETEGIVEELRSIRNVEISALLKEYGSSKVKVSLRAKRKANVAEIAGKLGGGGHEKAAGFTLNMPLCQAFEITKKEIQDNLEKYDN